MNRTLIAKCIYGSGLTATFTVLVPVPALAIPSPELVIGSISSLTQVGAFLSAILGGGILAIGKGRNPDQPVSGVRRYIGVTLVLICVALVTVNLYQFQSYRTENVNRLQATLTRPANAQASQVQDPNLKETSFVNQISHDNAILAQETEQLLFRSDPLRKDVVLIDIRENAENATGTIPGASHIRFPDFSPKAEAFKDKKVVLFCQNGNRSSETCARLAALGIDCSFIAGGLEKWIVEGRPFTDETVRSLSNLRAIPDFPNRQTLTSTATVHDLVNTEGAIFLDVRYPAEFAQGHLPGAINIPLRALTSDVLAGKILELPKKPIISACYDRRGCFISQVLGYELTQAGFDFRGRYTLPWEYFVPPAMKPHVAAWLQEQQKSYWARTTTLGAALLTRLSDATAPILAIFLLSLASRILVLPIALKSERDQITLRQFADEQAALKQSAGEDGVLKARYLSDFNRQYGLTPVRNLLALAFLPLMMLGLASVQAATAFDGVRLGWVRDLGQSDPLFIFPLAFTFAALFYLATAVARTLRQAVLWSVIGGPVLLLMTVGLSAAGVVYLCFSMVLLAVQRLYVTGHAMTGVLKVHHGIHRALRRSGFGLIRLDDQVMAKSCGNKAYRLSVAKNMGISVPDGVIMPTALIAKYLQSNDAFRAKLQRKVFRALGPRKMVVRSSGGSEDNELQSFAGVYDSVLNVDESTLEDAIRKVAASFQAGRSRGYSVDGGGEGQPNILIQIMIDAEFSGVLFTKDVANPGLAKLEMVNGTADGLVSGMVTPRTYDFGRFSHEAILDVPEVIDFAPLLTIAMSLEVKFDAPQDIEWTWLDGGFHIVQSRDITATGIKAPNSDPVAEEWSRIFDLLELGQDPQSPVFTKDEMAEVLPRPTPLSLDYMSRLWENGGSVDLACRQLGLTYHVPLGQSAHLVTVFNRLFSDADKKQQNSVVFNARALKSLRKEDGGLAQEFRTVFAPEFLRRMRLWDKVDTGRLSVEDLQDRISTEFKEFIHATHVQVERINIAASFFLSDAKAACEACDLDFAKHFGTSIAQITHESFSDEGIQSSISDQLSGPLGGGAHRSEFDYELSCPRFIETGKSLAEDFGIREIAQPKVVYVVDFH